MNETPPDENDAGQPGGGVAENSHALKAQAAAQHEEFHFTPRYLQAVLDHAQAVISVKDRAGRYLFVNPRFETVFQRTGQDVLGRRDAEIFAPELAETFQALDERVLTLGEPIEVEEAVAGHAGDQTFYSTRFPLRNEGGQIYALCSISTEMTARVQAERAMRESEARKAAVLNSALDGVITIDHRGLVVEVNTATERIFGYAADEMIGRDMAELIVPPALREAHRRGMQHFLATGHGPVLGRRVELPAMRKDGTEFPIELAIIPIMLEGPPMFTGHIRDITDRKLAEEEVNKARDRAERATRAKDEFLSRMSHELRTPLNAILGFGQLLKRTEMTERQEESVEQIARAGRHLLGLINEVLDLARIESGHLSMSPEPVELAELVREALELVRPLCEKLDLVVTHELIEGAWVQADRQRLRQVLLNLFSNAAKYNRANGTMSVRTARSGLGRFAISIRDTGIGIDASQMETLFVPFERHGDLHGEIEGTGIGLAITKRLVEAMGGSVAVESEPDVGSTFTILLPATTAPSRKNTQRIQLPGQVGSTGARRGRVSRRILYVEDNPANMRLMETILEERGDIEMLKGTRGDEALGMALELRPEIILLDLHLPGMSGEAVLRHIRADERLASTPVIIVSADALPRQVERLRSLGASDYLIKPLEVEDVLRVVQHYLSIVEITNADRV